MFSRGVIAMIVILAGARVLAGDELDLAPVPSTAALVDTPEGNDWSFSLSVAAYFVPEDRDYVQPTFTADRDWLHLEARYNYEDIDTASLWVGYNFSLGDELSLEITPMFGGVFGRTRGVAPGYRATLSWRRLELYTEGEYVFDFDDSSECFFYTWSELSVWATEWLRVGAVIQRTKVYETDFDFQRGFLIGLAYRRLNFTTYVFNPDDDPTVVLAVGIEF